MEDAGIWFRASTRTQDEASQLPDLMQWVESHGYNVAARYQVHGRSAFKGNRKFDETWAQVISDIESGKITVLVVWKQDRIDRKLQTFQMLQQVVDAGGRVEFVTQPHLNDLTTMGGRISLKVQEEIAYAESKDKSDRVRIKHDALRKGNTLIGAASFGYRIMCTERCGKTGKECKHGKTLEPVEELVPYAKGMAERYLAGDSLAAICRWLDEEGIKPRAADEWQPTAVRDILSNPALTGRRVDAKGRVELEFAPILDTGTWERLQARLAENPGHGRIADEPALLTSIIFCALCGRIMHHKPVYSKRKDGSKKYNFYYRCQGTHKEKSTCKNMYPAAKADSRITNLIMDVFGPLEMIERVNGNGHTAEIADIEAAIRDLDLDDPGYDGKHLALRAERKRLMEPSPGPVDRRTGVLLRDHWESLGTTRARRAWLLAGGIKVTVLSERRDRETGEVREGRFAVEGASGAQWTVGPLGLVHPKPTA